MSVCPQQIFRRHLWSRHLWHGRLVALLLPIGLVPISSCAEDVYLAQNYPTPPPNYSPQNYVPPAAVQGGYTPSGQFLAPPQLGELVSRIALYPDDLIGIILPAATFPLQVVEASRYLDAVRGNSTLSPDQSWDNSVVALLNYPDVVNIMNHDLQWTEALGQAVINQQTDVINAIGQFRAQAQAAGNLRSDERQVVEVQEGAIRIRPANPQIIYVPQYEPTRVVVYQSEPVFGYYPRPYPVYYYNYSSGYPSGFTNFWGVSTLFSIGWSTGRVHLHDYDYYDDPRFDHPYNGYFYRRGRHDWHDDDESTWGENDHHEHHDGDDHHGRGEPPRERDWHPHGGGAIAVGGGGRHNDPQPRAGSGVGTEQRLPAPTPTMRDSSPRRLSVESGGGETSVRRSTIVTVPEQPASPSFNQRRSVTTLPQTIEAPTISAPTATRRASSFGVEQREAAPAPMQQRIISAPAPRSVERQSIAVPRSSFSPPAPVRSTRDAEPASSARIAPSRPEPRAVVVAPRGGDGPTSTRRASDDDDRRRRAR